MNEHIKPMYELEFPAPVLSTEKNSGPTLVIALQGYADAGHAVDASSEHLLAALEHRPVVSFNNDEFIDYRSRRPVVTLDHNSLAEIDDLHLGIHAVHDNAEQSFLLLSGPEPDLRWTAFSEVVGDLVERYNVSQTVCLYAAPMAVPHTRPLMISAHGNDHSLFGSHHRMDARFQIPGSAALYIERELVKRGCNVVGFTAHVPHYVSASAYPQATLQLLEAVAEVAQLELPLRTLEEDAAKVALQIEEQMAQSHEVSTVVELLEQQYDEAMARYEKEQQQQELESETDTVVVDIDPNEMPSGEELGEEFEKFLADLDSPEDPEHPQI
ncbi:PAC2 family protein [Corynebacterium felinum]|uniref:ATP-grasp superfamily ATP-dependent carboligase n=1 Tax=Corynebacterium felinum TaxID=131318 RepID=A0ABU2BDQ2_9CORY|nr:putative ATP-grasp superfamily ATP-dependent carboligase [Corynebacterium felinum]WJY95201.1 PAC2 family protein [Corynebacterium felinum]